MKKKLSLAVICLFLMSSSSSFACIKVIRTNGGPNGYNKIAEGHTEEQDYAYCDDPGYSECKFEDECKQNIRVGGVGGTVYNIKLSIEANIELQIKSGTSQGFYYIDQAHTAFVSWFGTDIYNYTYEINGDAVFACQ